MLSAMISSSCCEVVAFALSSITSIFSQRFSSGRLSVNSYDDFRHLVRMLRNAAIERDPDLSEGGVLCLVGPTGSGKNEIARELVNHFGMVQPETATTRPKREMENGNYRFLSEEEFISEAQKGRFLETTVYSGHHFGTEAEAIDRIVDDGKIAVIPIDICGALTLKNRYRAKAMLAFLKCDRYGIIRKIVSKELSADDKTCRILSLDDEYRNEELCDLTVSGDASTLDVAKSIVKTIRHEASI